jgi:hypothetical protein
MREEKLTTHPLKEVGRIYLQSQIRKGDKISGESNKKYKVVLKSVQLLKE